jgi:hypothetical protein
MLELFIGLTLELLKLLFLNYSFGINFFFHICDFNFLPKLLLFTFFLEFALKFPFFPKKNHQVAKNQHQENILVWGGGKGG